MIPAEREAEIVRLHYAEHWPIGTIAKQLHVHHSTVRRVLAKMGVPEARQASRASIIDPYVPLIVKTLETYPSLTAARLYEMAKARGYPGAPDYFRAVVARYRPRKPAEAYLRVRTLPGEQAQVDWGHFGKLRVGRAERPLMAFVMVLSWSRMVFLRFFLGQSLGPFLRGHLEAFAFFGGVPRTLLYDNLKSAVLERRGEAIRFNPTLLDFASHYRYEPRPVAVARGNEKGRVERAIRYVRSSFFAARTFRDLDDLNAQARGWCEGLAADRPCPEDRSSSVREAFREEQPRLLALPSTSFPAEDRAEVSVGKTPYVRFDLNDYSVPHTQVRKKLVVFADEQRLRILDGNEVLAQHRRSYGKAEQIEDPRHIAELVEYKAEARESRGTDRLHHAAPESRDLLQAIADRGHNLGSAVASLLRLLDSFGAVELQQAIREACASGAAHVPAVRQILDRRLHERGLKPRVPVPLPDDPRFRNLVVKPHALHAYDQIEEETQDEDRS